MSKLKVCLFVGEKNFQQKKKQSKTQTGYKRHYERPFFEGLKNKVEFEKIGLYPIKSSLPAKIVYLWNQFWHPIKLRKLFKKEGIKHIMFAEEAFLLRFLKNPKNVVVSCLDLIPLAFPKEHGFLFKTFYKIAVKGMKKADLVITNSEYTKNEVMRLLDISKDKIVVAYPPVKDIFRPIDDIPFDFYQKYSLNPGKNYLLYVGGLDLKRKNIDMLLESLSYLKKRNVDCELILAGYTCAKSKTEELGLKLIDLGIEDITRIYSNISDEDLVYFYNVAKLFVFPSLYEGFGLPPLEAMACGTPVIASLETSIPEVCGPAAFYTNPFDETMIAESIEVLLNEPNLQKEMTEKGIIQAKKFSEKNYAQSTYKAYKKLS